jgi:hypothetical protein
MNTYCQIFVVATKKAAAILLFLGLMMFLTSPLKAQNQIDTTFSVTFEVNMAKAISQGVFDPDTDLIYVIIDHEIGTTVMVPAADEVYTLTLPAFDSGVTYNYKYRINDTIWESVNRYVTPVQGNILLRSWWNNIPLNVTIFNVNMTYAADAGLFNPQTDSVMITGTMNAWQPAKLERIDTSMVFRKAYPLDPGEVHQYKYRIMADTIREELAGKPDRIVRITDTLLQITNFFNNINPAWLPMTFVVDMHYYAETYRFFPLDDFVDVAGNFNNQGANDVLFDVEADSIYSLTTFIDTSFINAGPLAFKFRINGSWAFAELSGKPDRTYAFHDTTITNPNIFEAWYNDLDPSVPTPPWVEDLAIQGKLINHQILTGIYSYQNVNNIPEGISKYKWYESTDSLGLDITPIDSGWYINITIDTTKIGKWIVFEMTPVAAFGDSATGSTVRVISTSKVGGVGIDELETLSVKIYPNPVTDLFTIETREPLRLIEITDMTGRRIVAYHPGPGLLNQMHAGDIPAGFYLMKVYGTRSGVGVSRFMKR